MRYLVQAGKGQLSLANHARPITEILEDERTSPRIRDLLSRIPSIKTFGENYGINPTSNYTQFVQLNRSAVVWVVSASEPLQFKSKTWSFPFFGNFPYLGWFDIKDAKEFAEDLKRDGLDVDVRGARAYSTLGWFSDPVLSTMIPEGGHALGELVNVVIHESVHATLYIPGQSYFDESLASFVADELTPIYLEQIKPGSSKEYLDLEKRGETYRVRMHRAYESLQAIYASDRTNEEKAREKARILEDLGNDLNSIIGNVKEINNATLVQFRTYGVGTKEFTDLFRACGKDWPRFFAALKKLKRESFSKQHQEDMGPVLAPLAQGC